MIYFLLTLQINKTQSSQTIGQYKLCCRLKRWMKSNKLLQQHFRHNLDEIQKYQILQVPQVTESADRLDG